MGKRKKTSGENEIKYGKFSRKIRRVGYVMQVFWDSGEFRMKAKVVCFSAN